MQAAWLGMEPPERTEIDTPAREGDVLQLGPAEFHVLETPGHTQGSISLWIPAENKLVAGDTLFRESIGRTDLPGGDGRQIVQSIREKLFKLPDDADSDSRTRRRHHHRPREALQSLCASIKHETLIRPLCLQHHSVRRR